MSSPSPAVGAGTGDRLSVVRCDSAERMQTETMVASAPERREPEEHASAQNEPVACSRFRFTAAAQVYLDLPVPSALKQSNSNLRHHQRNQS